jgi:hypothetical protein
MVRTGTNQPRQWCRSGFISELWTRKPQLYSRKPYDGPGFFAGGERSAAAPGPEIPLFFHAVRPAAGQHGQLIVVRRPLIRLLCLSNSKPCCYARFKGVFNC